VFLAFFLLRFCLVRGEKVVSAQDFGWRSKGEDYFKSRFPFFSFLLVTIQILSGYLSCPKTLMYNSFIVFDRGFSFFLCFLPIFDRELSFFFFAFSQSLIENFLFSSEGKDGHSHPGSRFMVSWDFGSRLVEQLDMIYVRVLVWLAIQG